MTSFTATWFQDKDGRHQYGLPDEDLTQYTSHSGDVIGTVYHPNYGSCFVILPVNKRERWNLVYDAVTVPVFACRVTKYP